MEEKHEYLTPEQDWQLAEWYSTAQQIELSTEPVLRGQVNSFISTVYSDANFQTPKIVWCESPLAIYFSRSIVLLFAEFYDQQNGCLRDESIPNISDAKRHPGENVRWKIRDNPIGETEAVIRTACSFKLWYSLTSIELARNWQAVSIHDRDSVLNPIIRTIGSTLREISRFEFGEQLQITDTTWQSALSGAEQVLGYVIPQHYRDFKTITNHRWPFFFQAMNGYPSDCGFGQHDMRSLAIPAFFNKAIPEIAEKFTQKTEALIGLTEGAGWYLPHANVIWVSERQTEIVQDDRGRPHCESGPAIAFNDGWEIYAWHGIPVDKKIILEPDSLTVEEIDAIQNVEVRRVVLERFGLENYFLAGKTTILDDDPEFGTLLVRETSSPFEDQPIFMLRVFNSPDEPDGTRKVYLLRVPPFATTARQAVAWTFGLSAEEYNPDLET